MIASSSVVLANLAYLLGAVVFAVIGGTLVWLRHRQPKSVDANVESFNRGLRALAPEAVELHEPTAGTASAARVRPQPGGLRVIRSDIDLSDDGLSDIDVSDNDLSSHELSGSGVLGHDHLDLARDESGAEEAAGERAGAESG